MREKIDRDLPLKKIIAENIKNLMRTRGWKQKDLSERTGISKSTLSDYLNCNTLINAGNVEKIAEIFGVLKSDIDPSFKSSFSYPIKGESIYPENVETSTRLPLYGSVAAGALAEIEGVTTEDVEYISMPRKFLGKYWDCEKLFAMQVNGESMNKIIKNESIVIAKPMEQSAYKDGDIVIFSYNNEYSLKRFSPSEVEGFILFKSESTDKTFKDIPVPKDTLNDLKIYGKVIFYGTTL